MATKWVAKGCPPGHEPRYLKRAMTLLPALALLALAGCASGGPQAPTTPLPSDIAARYSAVVGAGMAPADYANVGTTLAEQNCDDYFTKLISGGQQTTFATQLATLLGLGASAAATAAGGGVGAIALPMVASGLFGQGANAYQQSQAAGSDPVGTYALVSKAMVAQSAAMPPITTSADADAAVTAIASNCRLPKIQLFVRQALMTAPVYAGAPQDRALYLSPHRIEIPVVTVGN